jgi:hypothetical protein
MNATTPAEAACTTPLQFFRPPERRPVAEQPALPEWLGPPQYEVGVLVPVQGAV